MRKGPVLSLVLAVALVMVGMPIESLAAPAEKLLIFPVGRDCTNPPNLVLGADLERCNLTGTRLPDDMRGANLTNANLYGANQDSVNLTGANLFDARMPNANLTGANLSGANMAVANFGSSPSLWGNNTKCPDTTFSQDNGTPPTCIGHLKY